MISTPDVPDLDIQVGETQTIVSGANYVSMFKFADGSIIVDSKRSYDAGKTWQNSPSFHVGAYQFPDGEIIQLGFNSKKIDRQGDFEIPLIRSTDNGRSTKTETAIMHIPKATGGTGDNGKPVEGPLADHAIISLSDRSIMAAMYGWFATDQVLVPTMPTQWQCFKYRSFVVRSQDRGRTWEYLSTVAYDPTVGLESFCEPDLLSLPEGDILCFMRTGGSGGKYTPLYLSRSKDDGKTWSKPEPIADRGVWPNTCLMENGVIVCTYGRPGNWLAFSLNGGYTWKGHFCFYDGRSTSYNSVEETAKDQLLVVYDRQVRDDKGNKSWEVAGTYVTVKRK